MHIYEIRSRKEQTRRRSDFWCAAIRSHVDFHAWPFAGV